MRGSNARSCWLYPENSCRPQCESPVARDVDEEGTEHDHLGRCRNVRGNSRLGQDLIRPGHRVGSRVDEMQVEVQELPGLNMNTKADRKSKITGTKPGGIDEVVVE